jgi:hypothetical protein
VLLGIGDEELGAPLHLAVAGATPLYGAIAA